MKEQVQLLNELPRHLKIAADDAAWPKLAEPAFAFWDNPEDAIYDTGELFCGTLTQGSRFAPTLG